MQAKSFTTDWTVKNDVVIFNTLLSNSANDVYNT